MSWYRTGSVSVTNGSTTVTGDGTSWVGAVNAGWGFIGPDGQVYEIAAVVGATELTLASPYQGGTQGAASYAVIPTQGLEQSLVAAVSQLLTDFQGVLDTVGQGKFPDGAVAQPGVRFQADEDTGLYRPAANQLAASTGGVLRWLLSSTAFQVDVPITGAAVQSSDTDTTAGRLLKVGAFGLGDTGNNSHLANYAAAAGVSQLLADGITSTPSDKPSAGRAHAGIHVASTDTRWMQLLAEVAGGSDLARLHWRRNYNGAVSDWQEIFSQGNILGTVSETAGVPTGALIERDTNANGEYVRFADGTQICTHRITSSASAAATWFFPATFETCDAAFATRASSGDAHFGTVGIVDGASANVSVWDTAGSRVSEFVYLVAIGRWF